MERPCSEEEEWKEVSNKDTWGALRASKFAFSRSEESGDRRIHGGGVSTTAVASRVAPPKSPNPPPPLHHSTLRNGRRERKSGRKEKAKAGQKGGKDHGSRAKGGKSRGKSSPQVEEEGPEPMQYTSWTAGEQACGARKKQAAWGRGRWNDQSNREWSVRIRLQMDPTAAGRFVRKRGRNSNSARIWRFREFGDMETS